MVNSGLDLLASQRFDALEFTGDAGTRTAVFGHLADPPTVSPGDEESLRLGLPLILSVPGGSGKSRTFMLRRVDRGERVHGTLVGEVSPNFLWATLASSMPSPSTMVSVVDDSGECSSIRRRPELVSQADPINEAAPLPAAAAVAAGTPRPAVRLRRLADRARRSLRRADLDAGPERDRGRGAGPDGAVLPDVPVGRAVLRAQRAGAERQPDPPEPGAAGRAARGDPADRAARLRAAGSRSRAGDEFEELATSFNAMAVQLGRQFQALSTAAELDRAVLVGHRRRLHRGHPARPHP